MFDLLTLQQYWWFLISVIGALFIFMTFVQGGQTLFYTLAKTEDERDLLVNSLGRKWELTFTMLVMFGGALFAAFPLFYAVNFGGAYYVWMIILFCFIIQAVAYEYRKKPDNVYGERFYEILLYINGSVGIFFIGIAVATLFSGGNFIVNDAHLSHWTEVSYGLEAMLNPFNIAFGLMLVFLSRVQASLYFLNSVEESAIIGRIKKVVMIDFSLFLVLFLYVLASILFSSGFTYDASTHLVSIMNMKFLHSFMDMPILIIMLLIGVLSLLYGVFIAIFKSASKAIWFSGLGTILSVLTLLLVLGLDNSVYYPSLAAMQSSLTIENSSSSLYTLNIMSIVSLLVPIVLAYIVVMWRAMDAKKITIDEVKSDSHHY